ncbi:Ethylene-responsive transcription factor ERF098 [Spatholobus suberectus]|nr:Ethylene-responsive transcription factor ERF098 [Spatholobus suberectus]
MDNGSSFAAPRKEVIEFECLDNKVLEDLLELEEKRRERTKTNYWTIDFQKSSAPTGFRIFEHKEDPGEITYEIQGS